MTPELWQRLKPLYNAALDLPPPERSGFLEEICGSDAELAAELRVLLTSEESPSSPLDTPLAHLSQLFSDEPVLLTPGSLLAGRFRIVRHLGSGGMGDVYEALDEQMEGSRIALKTIRRSIAENAAALTRFKDEVRLARRVSGPNVCRIHELYLISPDHHPECRAFLTMELLEGTTLHDRIAEASPLPVSQLRGIAEQLCAALRCIHEAGIVHQDLKPRNVMLVPHNGAERVVVTDFGLARALMQATGKDSNSGFGSGSALVVGTPSYMAPEQFEGREVGPPTDIYALGLILYEMATGIQPYAAHTPLAAAMRRSKAPAQPSSLRTDLNAAWDATIACCLKYEPDQRYQTAEQVSKALSHSGKVFLRLGQYRFAIPVPALATTAALATLVLCAGLWFAFGRPRHRELSPDATHWYALGMTALREGSYLKATRLLTMVTERDPTYALAHAALADAWTELDFTGAAQREMLLASAPQEQRGLNEEERRYIDAVRTTLIRDYSAATQDYEDILRHLPDDNKAQGYVDLGRIYEKAGKVPETLASYQKAASLNPDDPAAFLHLGILKSRLRDPASADVAFARAEALYSAESDQEGLAEVTYQRGYAANEAGKPEVARNYIERSLATAKQIPSLQLEIRSLSQLSTVAYNSNEYDHALDYAEQVSRVADQNGLEYWSTDARIRAANAHMLKSEYAQADAALQDALHQAQANGHPRLEAASALTLASLRYQQDRWTEQMAYARQALKYFQDYGFLDGADRALILIGRAQRELGDREAALRTGNAIVAVANKTHSTTFAVMGEELVGGVLLNTDQYPAALAHYDSALALLQQQNRDGSYQQFHRAAALWRLGRYNEAETALHAITEVALRNAQLAADVSQLKAELQLSQGQTHTALEPLAPSAKGKADATSWDTLQQRRLRLLALADRGRWKEASSELQRSEAVPQTGADTPQAADIQLLRAQVHLHTGNFAKAQIEAQDACKRFTAQGRQESEAQCLLTEAQLKMATGNRQEAVVLSRQSLDIYRQLEQSWGVSALRVFFSRPDRKQTLQDLASLSGVNGASFDALFQ